jgi:hypothetical protein
MERFARGLAVEASGAALPLVAMSMTALLGFAALTVDLGYGYLTGERLQTTADSAALAAAEQLALTNSVGGTAVAYARQNMPVAEHGEVLAPSDVRLGRWNAADGTFTASATPANAVSVTTRRAEANGNPLKTFLAGVIGFDQVDLSRTAIAFFQPREVGNCVLALRRNGTGIEVNSNGRITTNRCNVYANSSANNSMITRSNARITAQDGEICTVGRVSGSGYSPAAKTRCAVAPDPLASLPEPTLPPCTHTSTVEVEGQRTLNPGRYCDGIEIESGANVTFNPGTYIIEGDEFEIESNAVAAGEGVTIILRDKDAYLTVNQNSRIQLTAPTSGPYKGVAIYASRRITQVVRHEISSNSTSVVNGAIYIPTGELFVKSNGQVFSFGSCLSIIAFDILVNSNSQIIVDNNFGGCGLSPISGSRKIVSLVN